MIVFLHGNDNEGFDDSVLYGNINYDFDESVLHDYVFLHTNGNDDFDDNNEHNDNSLLRGRLHGTLSSYADAPPRPVQLSLLTKMSKKNFYYY